MKVSDLIELLKSCDPNALVVINDECMCEDDKDVMAGAMQRVEAVEVGWSYPDILWDMTFSRRPIGEYLVPAVRLIGHNGEETDADRSITINGISAMKDVAVEPVRRLK